jgi:hypothetical protein
MDLHELPVFIHTHSTFFHHSLLQGGRIAAPLVPWIIGYVLFVAAAFGCTSFQVEIDYYDDKVKFGYWGIDNDPGGCTEYVKEELDGALKTGRAIGIVGTILGPIAILLFLTTSFLAVPRAATLTLGIVTGVLMPLFCGIMFIGLATDVCTKDEYDEGSTCLPAAKGYLLAPALLFWIGGSIPLCICFKERRPRDRQTSPEQQKSPIQASANYSYPRNNIEMPQEDY